MKIAVWWNLHPGGARRALRDHLRGLAERGHEIHVVRPPVPKPEWMAPDEFATSITEVPLPSFEANGSGYIGNVLAELRRVRSLVPAMEAHSVEAGRRILDLKPDVLFAQTCWLMAAPSIVRHVGDLPRALYLQEPKRSLYEANPTLPWVEVVGSTSMPHRIRRRISLKALARQARIERENAMAAGEILVNSYFSRESVRRAYGLDSTVCYLGVDTDLFTPGDLPRGGFVLGVGAVAPTKGVATAIEACAEAALPLVWVGPFEDSAYGPEMRALALALGVVCEWRIGIPDEELIRLYQSCLCVIATAKLEPFGYTPIEAGACGAPVVAIAEGGFRETVRDRHNGYCGEAFGTTGVLLARIGNSQMLQRRFGANGRESASVAWNLDDATTRVEKALERAISRDRPQTG